MRAGKKLRTSAGMTGQTSDSTEEALGALRRSSRHYFQGQILLAVLVSLSGATWLWLSISQRDYNLFTLFASCLLIGLGLYAMYGLVQLQTKEVHRALGILAFEPERVVWMYIAELQMMPFGVDIFHRTGLHLGLHSGETLRIRATVATIHTCIRAFAAQYPHITTGYDINKQQLFDVAPELLERTEDDQKQD